jgi:flagellar biosynthesis/type III secretory pathway M-ring protein FliF/YscJ
VAIGGVAAIELEIRAGWENIAILITGIGVVLLFGFGIVRSVRKRRRAREAGERETGEPEVGEPDDRIDAGHERGSTVG